MSNVKAKIKGFLRLVKNYWEDNEREVLFILAICLVAAVAFQTGKMNQNFEGEDMGVKASISGPYHSPQEKETMVLGETVQRKQIEVESRGSSLTENKECVLIGSKNSDKYHEPTCRYAKNIKSENLVCFSSEEEAVSKGYKPAGCCHK
jgi:hypothetical protein